MPRTPKVISGQKPGYGKLTGLLKSRRRCGWLTDFTNNSDVAKRDFPSKDARTDGSPGDGPFRNVPVRRFHNILCWQ
jgi:hypothetical protein